MTGAISQGLQEQLSQLGILAPVDPEAKMRWRSGLQTAKFAR